YSSEPQLESRIRPNLNPLGSNAYYYCIRHPKPVMAAPAKARVKAAAKAPAKAKAKASTKAAAKKDAAKTPAKAAAKAPAN
ncbi:MAG: hypothetical protein KA294_10570, partial [Giesbergeria sp.]|nr:hypothetical protein [Giesbergeria sp.]